MNSILIIQTASIGDVILATPLLEKLHQQYPNAHIDLMVKKGNESLFIKHPFLRSIIIRNKKERKVESFIHLLQKIYSEKYDLIINLQRFSFTTLLTVFSGAKFTTGYAGNLFSLFYTKKYRHSTDPKKGVHETSRNQQLISKFCGNEPAKMRLYPSQKNYSNVSALKTTQYICIAPASLWKTKQLPGDQWAQLITQMPSEYNIYLLGSDADKELCEDIIRRSRNKGVMNLAGKLSLLDTAALMEHSRMNYVNDSAPMHIASAMNAPVAAVFCSTVPGFGFGPLSEKSMIIETKKSLTCRPCGLHGHDACPKKHFDCAKSITTEQLLKAISS